MSDHVRFVHAADLHLDAPFQGITATDPRIGAELADATYAAFKRVVETCLTRDVAFLVIAGDAYNSADKSLRAQLRFRTEMERLAEAGIEVFIVNGNHDPQSGWSAGLSLPETVHVFPTDRVERIEVVRNGEVIAAVYGRSFARAAEVTNLALGYHRDASDPVAIGVLHANVGGNGDYEPYAAATLDDLRSARMDYWALGHIHKQEVLAEHPWIVYAGSPQGLNPKETGPHGCLVVEISRGGATTLEHVETAPIAWAQTQLDASEATDLEDIRALLLRACEDIRTESGRHTVARIALVGRSAAHADLSRPGVAEQLFDDIRAEGAVDTPWVWIDRLVDRTSPLIDLDELRSGPDFAAELVRIADELAADPVALDKTVDELASPLATTLSGYCRQLAATEALDRARDAALDLLLTRGDDRR